MRIHCGYTVALDTFASTPMVVLLNVRPERQPDLVTREVIAFDPPVAARQFRDPFGNVATRILVPGGRITMAADFEIEDHGRPDDYAPDARQIPVQDLPDEALPFLLGSRYCDTDKFAQTAWNLFGSTPEGWSRVQAIVDYAHGRLRFDYMQADATRSAFDEGYEFGTKVSLLDGQLSATTAVFDIRRTNVLTVDPVDPNFSVAAGEVRSRGFDLTVAGYLAPGWRVIGTYTHADAAVSRDNTLPVGARIANIPADTFAVQSVYKFQGGAVRGLGLGGGLSYVGQRVAGTALSTFRLPDYTVVNLISYYWITPQVRVYLNVDNLLDTSYYDRAFQNRYATPGTPRTIMGGVAARF